MTTPAPHFVQTGYTHESFNGPACALNVRRYGLAGSPSVLMTSSILASSQMWHEQALLLSACGFQVLALDTRGHGDSKSNGGAYHMNDLVADSVSVLDHFGVSQAHYIGLSLGGMSGFGLAQQHANRLLSLILCDCRADMTQAFAAPWDERIALAQLHGCEALARPTLERWFGAPFLDANPNITERFIADIARTQVAGFVGCAHSITWAVWARFIRRSLCWWAPMMGPCPSPWRRSRRPSWARSWRSLPAPVICPTSINPFDSTPP